MKLLKVIIFTLVFNFGATQVVGKENLYFDSLTNRQKIKEVEKMLKQKRKEERLALRRQESQAELDMETCIGDCKSILNFTKDVTGILAKLEETQDATSYEALKVGELVGISEYVQFVSDKNVEQCLSSENSSMTSEFSSINEEELQLIFAKDVDPEEFQGAQLHEGETKHTYFFRGRDENANKVVKVAVEKDKDVKVEIYEIADFDESKINYIYKDEKIESKKKEKNILDYATTLTSNISSSGPKITFDEEYNLPRKITLVELEGSHDFIDGYKLNSNVEVSDRRQNAKMTLVNLNGQELSVVELDKSGEVTIGIPYSFDVDGSDIGFRGSAVVGEHKARLSTSVMYKGVNYMDASISNNLSGQTVTLGKNYILEGGSSMLSIKYQKTKRENSSNEKDEEVFFVSYTRAF